MSNVNKNTDRLLNSTDTIQKVIITANDTEITEGLDMQNIMQNELFFIYYFVILYEHVDQGFQV